MRIKAISCAVLFREMSYLAARSPNRVDLEFLPKGLHDLKSAVMRERLQQEVDATSDGYDAIVMAYALCGNGLAGLEARSIPLIVPRAHDCIALFMGSRERYLEYFQANPGVYFKTSGWIERGDTANQITGYDLAELVAKYGEENAQYIYDQLSRYQHTYRKMTYIEMGIEPDDRFEHQTRSDAAGRGWAFEKIQGDLGLLRRLVDGDWSEADFLVVPSGGRVAPAYDDRIIKISEAKP